MSASQRAQSPDQGTGKNPKSTPNMTGRRFHRITELIPCRPWKSKSPFASRPMKINIRKGTRGVRATYDEVLPPYISVVWSPGRPVLSLPDNSDPEAALRSAPRDRGALRSAPETALEGALLFRHRDNPTRALSGALLRAGSGGEFSNFPPFSVIFQGLLRGKTTHKTIAKPSFPLIKAPTPPPTSFSCQVLLSGFVTQGVKDIWYDSPLPNISTSSSPENTICQELSGDPNPQYFLKSTAIQMGGVLP